MPHRNADGLTFEQYATEPVVADGDTVQHNPPPGLVSLLKDGHGEDWSKVAPFLPNALQADVGARHVPVLDGDECVVWERRSTFLHVAAVGRSWFVWRITGWEDQSPQRLPGLHRSKRAAMTAARKVAADTNERVDASTWKAGRR